MQFSLDLGGELLNSAAGIIKHATVSLESKANLELVAFKLINTERIR